MQREDLSEDDKVLLTRAQRGLPLSPAPFEDLGEELNMDGDEVVERLKDLKDKKLIRRIGGVFDSKKMGWESTLLAGKIPEDEFYEVAEQVNEHPGVTHNYRRDHEYNMWFTLSVGPDDDLQQEIKKLEEKTGFEFLQLPKKKKYKLGVKLDLSKEGKR
ncbi:MAG: Lrp/AsnC family transcriptional regulator [Thermoplasmata archaeon]